MLWYNINTILLLLLYIFLGFLSFLHFLFLWTNFSPQSNSIGSKQENAVWFIHHCCYFNNSNNHASSSCFFSCFAHQVINNTHHSSWFVTWASSLLLDLWLSLLVICHVWMYLCIWISNILEVRKKDFCVMQNPKCSFILYTMIISYQVWSWSTSAVEEKKWDFYCFSFSFSFSFSSFNQSDEHGLFFPSSQNLSGGLFVYHF